MNQSEIILYTTPDGDIKMETVQNDIVVSSILEHTIHLESASKYMVTL